MGVGVRRRDPLRRRRRFHHDAELGPDGLPGRGSVGDAPNPEVGVPPPSGDPARPRHEILAKGEAKMDLSVAQRGAHPFRRGRAGGTRARVLDGVPVHGCNARLVRGATPWLNRNGGGTSRMGGVTGYAAPYSRCLDVPKEAR